MKESLNLRRAIFVYEAARLAAIAANAPVVPERWDRRDKAFWRQFRCCVAQQCGPNRKTSPKELHDDWVNEYRKMGWRYGPVRNTKEKTHPDMVPYNELGQLEKDKDSVFITLCEVARQWIYD